MAARRPAGPRAISARDVALRPALGTVAPTAGVSCWICLTTTPEPGDRFVHACHCSLVACESCLLTWIASTQRSAPTGAMHLPPHRRAVKCPQCQAVFRLIQRKDRLLDAFAFVDSAWQSTALPMVITGVGLGVAVIATQYSRLAIRAFFGPRVTSVWLGPPTILSFPLLGTMLTAVPLTFILPLGVVARHPGLAAGWLVAMGFMPGALPLPSIGGLDFHVPIGAFIHYLSKAIANRVVNRFIAPPEVVAWAEGGDAPADEGNDALSPAEMVMVSRARDFFIMPWIAMVGGHGLLAAARALGGPKEARWLLGLADDRAWAAATGVALSNGGAWTNTFTTALGLGVDHYTIDPVWVRNFVAAELWQHGKRFFNAWRRARLFRQLTSRRIRGVAVDRRLGIGSAP